MGNAGYIVTTACLVIAALLISSRERSIDGTSVEAFERSHARLIASVPLDRRLQLSRIEILLAAQWGCLDASDTDDLAAPERFRTALTPCRRQMHGLTYDGILRRAGIKSTAVPLIPILLAIATIVVIACWIRDQSIKPDARLGIAQVVLLLSLLGPISAGFLVTSVRAIRDGEISIQTRSTPRATYERERDPEAFWFWTGGFYFAGVLGLGFSSGFAVHRMGGRDTPGTARRRSSRK